MIKNLFSLIRYTAVMALVAGLFVISGCDNGDDGPVIFNGTSLDFIKSDEFKQASNGNADLALDSLAKYVSLYPELTTLLSGTTEYTVFAPSNTAFKSLLATPGFPSKISLINPDIIKGVLSYHFVAGKKLRADMTAGTKFNTLYTDATTSTVQVIEVNSDGTTFKTGSTNQAIVVVAGGEDRQSNNGVVHVVGSVMIPPSVGASLTPILGTMAGTVLLGKDFTYLARLIARADAGYTENAGAGQLKVSSHLARPTSGTFSGATFFAPPNAVFEAAATAAGITATQLVDSFTTGGSGTARAVLLNHYVIGKYVVTAAAGSTTFTNGQVITTVLSGKAITVLTGQTVSAQNPYGVVLSNNPATPSTFRPIVSKDVSHSNGIVQVFGGILQ
jgi:uncharacterized surface protein with fasciclin (FAS1) repeats